MMEQFLIEGGHQLYGEIRASGNKNAALKMIPACLLTEETVLLKNVPNIVDVHVAVEIMRHLGADADWIDDHTLQVTARNIVTSTIDQTLATKIRASVVFAGPMLARHGEVILPAPGGDSIGERRLDTHTIALQKLGAVVEVAGNTLKMKTSGLVGNDLLLIEASVTATENAIMAAVLAKGTTVIRNAASEPHVQDLCSMLTTMGAQIDGAGTNRLVIHGVERLHGGEVTVGADYMEVGSFIGAAIMTGGEILIKQASPQYLEIVEVTFARLGVFWETRGDDVFVPAMQSLTVVPDLGNRLPIIKAQPWPAFPPDLMSIALVVATQCAGSVLFHDWMYESRFFFTDKLMRMGARITLCDPHRVLVQGPASLHGQPYITSPDIRAGMAILLAALAARGETRIFNIRQIDRGYERVDEKLRNLGAKILRIRDKAPGVDETQEASITEH